MYGKVTRSRVCLAPSWWCRSRRTSSEPTLRALRSCTPATAAYVLKAYLFGIFNEKYRTRQVGRAPYDPPDGGEVKLETASVSAVEAGVNASMA